MTDRINLDQMCAEASQRVSVAINRSAAFHLDVMRQQNEASEHQRREDYVAAAKTIQSRIERAQRECNVNPVLVNAYFSTIRQ